MTRSTSIRSKLLAAALLAGFAFAAHADGIINGGGSSSGGSGVTVKAWANFTASSTSGAQTINNSYNISGVSRTATGTYTVSFTTSFADANYACTGTAYTGTSHSIFAIFTSAATGSIEEYFVNGSGTATDPTDPVSIICVE